MNDTQTAKLRTKLATLSSAVRDAAEADYGAAGAVIATCEQALKRIVKRAATLSGEYETVEIVQSRGPVIECQAVLLAENTYEDHSGREPVTIGMEIYQTKGGALLAVRSVDFEDDDRRSIVRACVAPPAEDPRDMWFAVMDLFEWDDRARSMARKLGWSLKLDVD